MHDRDHGLRPLVHVVQTTWPVRATLIHNSKAGDRRLPDCDELVRAIEGLGWEVRALDKGELDKAVAKPGDVVVVAGGDGTVGKVAKAFAGTGVPVAVIPTGTANNVARTLGIGVEPRTAIQSLPRSVVSDVDLGVVANGKNAEERFIEGFGVGALAYVIAERATRKHKKLRRAFSLLAEELESYQPHHARIEVDGRDVSGDCLLASVLNLMSLGPALRLAPGSLFDDGELDLVLVRPDHKASLIAHLRRAALDGDMVLPAFETHRARHVTIRDHGKWAHVDDCARPVAGILEVRVEPAAVRFLVPPR